MRSIRETAFAFDRACRAAGLGYAVVGGFAVMAWGQPRATMDVDALVELDPSTVDRFMSALSAERLEVQRHDLEAVLEEGGHATIFDNESSFHIDLKLARTRAEREEVAAAAEIAFPDGRLRVARAEDTVAYKVLFGTDQDLQDARSIVQRQGGALDRRRVRKLALQLGIQDQVERILSEVDDAL